MVGNAVEQLSLRSRRSHLPDVFETLRCTLSLHAFLHMSFSEPYSVNPHLANINSASDINLVEIRGHD